MVQINSIFGWIIFFVCPDLQEFDCLDPRKNSRLKKKKMLPEFVLNKTMWLQDIPLRLQALSEINSVSLKWNAKQNSKEDRW